MWLPPATAALLAVLALGCGVARGDETRKPPEEPDLGFLEFLGSVDRLSDLIPDYLSQAEARAKTAAGATPPPPPPPRPPQPPSAPNGPGGHNNG